VGRSHSLQVQRMLPGVFRPGATSWQRAQARLCDSSNLGIEYATAKRPLGADSTHARGGRAPRSSSHVILCSARAAWRDVRLALSAVGTVVEVSSERGVTPTPYLPAQRGVSRSQLTTV